MIEEERRTGVRAKGGGVGEPVDATTPPITLPLISARSATCDPFSLSFKPDAFRGLNLPLQSKDLLLCKNGHRVIELTAEEFYTWTVGRFKQHCQDRGDLVDDEELKFNTHTLEPDTAKLCDMRVFNGAELIVFKRLIG